MTKSFIKWLISSRMTAVQICFDKLRQQCKKMNKAVITVNNLICEDGICWSFLSSTILFFMVWKVNADSFFVLFSPVIHYQLELFSVYSIVNFLTSYVKALFLFGTVLGKFWQMQRSQTHCSMKSAALLCLAVIYSIHLTLETF